MQYSVLGHGTSLQMKSGSLLSSIRLFFDLVSYFLKFILNEVIWEGRASQNVL